MIIKVIGIAFLGISSAIILKSILPTLSYLTSCVCAIIIFGICISESQGFIQYYYLLCERTGYSTYLGIMLKGLGIAVLTQIGGDICNDCGEKGLGSGIEFAGKIEILVISLPLVESLIELSENILTK